MNVIDVYAGTGSATRAFHEAGHCVYRVELTPGLLDEDLRICRCGKDHNLLMDARTFAANPRRYLPEGIEFGFGWFSPPCDAFTFAGGSAAEVKWVDFDGYHSFWGPRFPTSSTSRKGCAMVLASKEIVRKLGLRYWLIENPMGGAAYNGLHATP